MPIITRSLWGLSDFDPDQPSDLDPLREWLQKRWGAEHRHFQRYHNNGICSQQADSDPTIHAVFDTTIAAQARYGYLDEDALAQLQLPSPVEDGLLLFASLDQETRDEFYYSARRGLPLLGQPQAFARGVNEQLRWLGFTYESTAMLFHVAGASSIQAIEYAVDVCPYVKGSVEAVHLLLGQLWNSMLEAEEIICALRGFGLPIPNVGEVDPIIWAGLVAF